MLNGPDGPHHGIELQVLVHPVLSPHAGGVHQHEFVAELVVICRYGIPGRTCDRGDDVPLLPEQGIGERRLAHVRLADYGYVRKVGVEVFLHLVLRKQSDDFVEQVSGTAAVGRGYAPALAQAERVELIDVEHLLAGIHLVHAEHHRLAASPEDVGDFGVIVGDARGGLDHEEYHIGFVYSNDDLLADLILERIVRTG